MFVHRKDVADMDKRQEIIERIASLSDEQFDKLISLWTQQEQEFALNGQAEHLTSRQPA